MCVRCAKIPPNRHDYVKYITSVPISSPFASFLTAPKSTDSDRKFEKISYREEYEYRESTMVQINQEYRLKYWATR